MAFSSILYLWNKWNVRGLVILSLLLQVFLILFAPLRKKTSNNHIILLLWLAYLMADWIAAFGIGLISHNQGNSFTHVAEVDRALRAFWATFLLLHLGGPDTITAFSLEDSSLWRRHLLSLTFQVSAVIYVFVQIFPDDKSLVFPTMLVFLAGVIKNAERTLALKLSSLPRLKEWMLSRQESLDYGGEELVIELLSPHFNSEEEANLPESIVVKHAYYFFQWSKVFLTDLIFTQRERESSQRYFHKVSAMDAFKIISVELHFIYEVLHTKALTIRSKWSYVFRFVAFIDIVIAFVLFNHLKKRQLPELDVKITYLLLFGGIALDVIAVLMLVFSDCTIAEIQWHKTISSTLDSFLHNLVSTAYDLWKPRFAICEVEPNSEVTYAVLDTPLLFRRWSECIYACNLLSESLAESPRKMYKREWRCRNIAFSNICSFPFYMAKKTISCFHQPFNSIAGGCWKMDWKRSVIANTKYVSTNPFIMKLWIFIFKEVRRKYIYVIYPDEREKKKVKEIYEARGNWFLRTLPSKFGHRSLNDSDTGSMDEATNNEFPQNIQGGIEKSEIMFSVTDLNYYESIIIWHLATEICYNKEDPKPINDEREFSKILSDYMLYLLLNQPNLMSAVAGIAQIKLVDLLEILRDTYLAKNVKSLCEHVMSNPSLYLIQKKKKNPLLQRAKRLARELESVREGKWKVISGVWVEILSYAASHIKGEAHAQVLSKGGELLTFVWLLMIHFGLLYRVEWAPLYSYRQ